MEGAQRRAISASAERGRPESAARHSAILAVSLLHKRNAYPASAGAAISDAPSSLIHDKWARNGMKVSRWVRVPSKSKAAITRARAEDCGWVAMLP